MSRYKLGAPILESTAPERKRINGYNRDWYELDAWRAADEIMRRESEATRP